MKYTKYISAAFGSNGVPNLSPDNFKTLMNVIHLEGAISGVKKVQSRAASNEAKYKYNIWILDYAGKVDELTGGLEPKVFVSKLASSN